MISTITLTIQSSKEVIDELYENYSSILSSDKDRASFEVNRLDDNGLELIVSKSDTILDEGIVEEVSKRYPYDSIVSYYYDEDLDFLSPEDDSKIREYLNGEAKQLRNILVKED